MSPDFYRKEAERLQRLADSQTDPVRTQNLRQMAAEHDELADAPEGKANNKPSS